MSSNIDLVRFYVDALSRGDFAAAGSTFADDLVWHQPGSNACRVSIEASWPFSACSAPSQSAAPVASASIASISLSPMAICRGHDRVFR